MRIRTLVSTALTVSFFAVIAIWTAVWAVHGKLDRLSGVQTTSQNIVREVSSLLLLTNEYALHGEERTSQQWQAGHRLILEALEASLEHELPIPPATLSQAKALLGFFNQLVDAKSMVETDLQRRRIRTLLDQLLTHTQALFDTVHRWGESAATNHQQLENQFHALVLAVPVLLLLILLALAMLLLRRVLHPLSRLHESVLAVSKGDLSHRYAFRDDEFGAVSQTFDALAIDLVGQLKRSEERFKALSDASYGGIIIHDQGIILECNQGLSDITGFGHQELIGMNGLSLIAPASLNTVITHIENGYVQGYEVTGIRQDGTPYPLAIKGRKITYQGRDAQVMELRDITERKRLELEIEQHRDHLQDLVRERTTQLEIALAAAETANRAKGTFLANMSHELRTPMNAIMGMTSLALRRVTDPKLKGQLGIIDQASQHLLAVINDILDISKIEAERLTLEQLNFKLGEVLENLVSFIGHKAHEKGLSLRIDQAPELADLTLRGDPLRLGQILLNLTGNAVKFTTAGNVIVHVRLLETGPSEALLRFEVTDTGIGIAQVDQQRLFTAFEQADGSMTRKYGGSGLGLAISKHLVHLMSGTIGVVSQPGAGSTFWFTVRLERVQPIDHAIVLTQPLPAATAEEQIKTRYAGTLVLLAEDEPVNQEVSRGLLEDAGFRVDLAEDGAIAVDMAQRTRYALILMDMQMPRLNGVEATRLIRTIPGYSRIPILAMTANAFEGDRQICLDAGMNDHISKPVKLDQLFKTLLLWLERQEP